MKIPIICQQRNMHYLHVFPQLSHILYDIEIGNKGNKNVYFNSLGNDSFMLDSLVDKWSETLNDDINIDMLTSFKNAKKHSPSVYQYFNQFKLLHRRGINNQLLKKMNLTDSDKCLYCKEYTETIEHIYLECTNSISIWNSLITWVRSIYDNHFIISDYENLFGGPTNKSITNMIAISVKDVIYQKRKSGGEMMITGVKRCLLKNLNILKSKEVLLDNLLTFENKWNILLLTSKMILMYEIAGTLFKTT